MKLRLYVIPSHSVSEIFRGVTEWRDSGIYLIKVNNRNARTINELSSKLTIKTPEQCQGQMDTDPKTVHPNFNETNTC